MIKDFTSQNTISAEQLIDRLEAMACMAQKPFNKARVSVAEALSARLLKSETSRQAPQFVALGYWLRSAAIKRLRADFEARLSEGQLQTPRGLAFHLPPANVDTLFVYSWVLSYLAGNANIVRLPSDLPATTGWLLKTVTTVLAEADEQASNLFCQYDYRTDTNRTISAFADLRLIWGGDEKIRQASVDPVRPDGLSIGFSDRKSHCIIKSEAYASLGTEKRNQLAEQLYNDIFWFDQLGCGSPRTIMWVGDAKDHAQDLYKRLVHCTEQKEYEVETGVAISKFAFANSRIASGTAQKGRTYSNQLSVLEAENDPNILSEVHGGGMLWDVTVERLEDTLKLVDRHTQTISHYGFEKSELMALAHAMVGKGGFRLVPVGTALSFEETWDGLPLLDQMTRRIVVQS